ncbi:hypothetical protein chiPu_0018566 [Chiloscyllium punctatum]|uniref:Uncharacterized protein n=1 Tax=Chiloscyllium punctatum TaxID=137246 RepID=A0A401RNV9_CHIPU|nr:hypothetical protein [Chiloscyllium punctatum]
MFLSCATLSDSGRDECNAFKKKLNANYSPPNLRMKGILPYLITAITTQRGNPARPGGRDECNIGSRDAKAPLFCCWGSTSEQWQ